MNDTPQRIRHSIPVSPLHFFPTRHYGKIVEEIGMKGERFECNMLH